LLKTALVFLCFQKCIVKNVLPNCGQKKATRRPPAPSTSSDHSLDQPPQMTSLPGLTSLYHPAHLTYIPLHPD